jgi:beta-ketoacyl-acyl-carrier-protein synthase II
MGMLSSLGHSVKETWENLIAGESGVDFITRFDASDLPIRIAGEVKDFNPLKYLGRKEARRMARVSQLAVAASQEALDDANLSLPVHNGERVGTVIGVGVGGFDWGLEHTIKFRKNGYHRTNPFALASSLPNMPSHHVSLYSGALGPISTPIAACATGVQAIGDGMTLIRHNKADMVLAGGAEGVIIDVCIAGFGVMGALSTRNDDPKAASRPFDRDRDGFVLAEGAGVVVLEELDHALSRGAQIYAEVLGYSTSSDAFHIAQPDPEARGIRRAMRWCLQDAELEPDDIDYVNAHGTATRLNDTTETYALKKVFGEHAYQLAVNSSKSMLGHGMGSAGAIESIITAKTIQTGIIHPTINLENPDPECDLDYTPHTARMSHVNYALKSAFGFGGQNACLILGKYDSR